MSTTKKSSQVQHIYTIYWDKHGGAYSIFHALSAALIQGWQLFESRMRQRIDCINYSTIIFHIKLTELASSNFDYIRATVFIRERRL